MSAPEADMVFLAGVGSGGTDLLMNVLNAHSAIFIPGELPFLPAIADELPAQVPAEQVDDAIAAFRRLDVYNTLAHQNWENFLADTKEPVELGPPPEPVQGSVSLARLYQWLLGVPDHIRWTGNKTPTNLENVHRLDKAFPDARFIVIVRDARDVAMSWRRRWDRDERMTADKWQRRLAAGRAHLAGLDARRSLIVRYEDLLEDLESSSRRMCEFLGLPFDERMLRFNEYVTKTIPGQENKRAPVISDNAGKWRKKMDPALARRIEEIAWEGLHHFGYDVAYAQRERALTPVERVRGRAQDVRAVVFNHELRDDAEEHRRSHLRRLRLHIRQRISHRDLTV